VRRSKLITTFGLAVGAAAAVVAVDQVSKRWAESSFESGRMEVVPDLLWFTYVENPGSAFSMFQNSGVWLGVAAAGAVGVIGWALRTPRPGSEVIGLGLVMGGAVGNLVDRATRGEGLLDGKVVDWIQVPDFPVFNMADTALTVGVGLVLLSAFRQTLASSRS
jgi:signal peptidase II